MAHLSDGKGPYPDKAGEFCGNHHPDSLPTPMLHETPEQSKRHHDEYLAKMRFGKPSNCEAGTSEEMAGRGWVGLYLKENRELLSFETPVETDKLTEDRVTGALTGAAPKTTDDPSLVVEEESS